jgi:hypothetical protein
VLAGQLRTTSTVSLTATLWHVCVSCHSAAAACGTPGRQQREAPTTSYVSGINLVFQVYSQVLSVCAYVAKHPTPTAWQHKVKLTLVLEPLPAWEICSPRGTACHAISTRHITNQTPSSLQQKISGQQLNLLIKNGQLGWASQSWASQWPTMGQLLQYSKLIVLMPRLKLTSGPTQAT